MAQEQFSGPEYFTEFDPEKFIRDLKEMAEMEKENKQASEADKNTDGDGTVCVGIKEQPPRPIAKATAAAL